MEKYFDKLPNLYYNNTLVKDISRRAVLVEDEKRSPYNFYPYDLKHQLRADHISEYYYNDAYLDWFIYLSNGIIDPYYGWPLNDLQFESLMVQKYGSIEQSMKRIAFYRNNWANDADQIEPSFYENHLPFNWRKYYKPIWGVSNKIISYSRKEDDTITNTNRISQYTITANANANTFVVSEQVDFKITGMTEKVGAGEVVVANSSVILIQSMSGNTSANSTHTKTIVGETSSANVTVNAVTILYENFPEDEEKFWTPISYYDHEIELNEEKKTIRLVDSGVHQLLVEDFSRKIRDGVDPLTNLSSG